jgi:hypothetical protein
MSRGHGAYAYAKNDANIAAAAAAAARVDACVDRYSTFFEKKFETNSVSENRQHKAARMKLDQEAGASAFV